MEDMRAIVPGNIEENKIEVYKTAIIFVCFPSRISQFFPIEMYIPFW